MFFILGFKNSRFSRCCLCLLKEKLQIFCYLMCRIAFSSPSYYVWETLVIVQIFDSRFLTDLQVLVCPEYVFTIFAKWLTSVCDTDFEATLAQKQMNGIAGNFIFSCILTWTGADYILAHIAQEVPMLFEIFDFFNIVI